MAETMRSISAFGSRRTFIELGRGFLLALGLCQALDEVINRRWRKHCLLKLLEKLPSKSRLLIDTESAAMDMPLFLEPVLYDPSRGACRRLRISNLPNRGRSWSSRS